MLKNTEKWPGVRLDPAGVQMDPASLCLFKKYIEEISMIFFLCYIGKGCGNNVSKGEIDNLNDK